jgi:diguanylate cyclase (GGDEF)-like protein
MSPSRSAPPPEDLSAEVRDLRGLVERQAAEIKAMRAHAARLETLAHEDALTGLLNRRGFLRDLTRAAAYQTRYGGGVALVMVDLDDFKSINDRFGHAAGDLALKAVAAILISNVRASDSVGRLGGDEFALIIWQIDEAAAGQKALSLEGIIAASQSAAGGTALPLAASAGVTFLEAEDTVETALARADRAMYARKRERNALRR